MNVYALLRGYDYEGDTLLGVYSEEWRALEAMADWIKDNDGCGDSFSIVMHEMDGDPKSYGPPTKCYNSAGVRE